MFLTYSLNCGSQEKGDEWTWSGSFLILEGSEHWIPSLMNGVEIGMKTEEDSYEGIERE